MPTHTRKSAQAHRSCVDAHELMFSVRSDSRGAADGHAAVFSGVFGSVVGNDGGVRVGGSEDGWLLACRG